MEARPGLTSRPQLRPSGGEGAGALAGPVCPRGSRGFRGSDSSRTRQVVTRSLRGRPGPPPRRAGRKARPRRPPRWGRRRTGRTWRPRDRGALGAGAGTPRGRAPARSDPHTRRQPAAGRTHGPTGGGVPARSPRGAGGALGPSLRDGARWDLPPPGLALEPGPPESWRARAEPGGAGAGGAGAGRAGAAGAGPARSLPAGRACAQRGGRPGAHLCPGGARGTRGGQRRDSRADGPLPASARTCRGTRAAHAGAFPSLGVELRCVRPGLEVGAPACPRARGPRRPCPERSFRLTTRRPEHTSEEECAPRPGAAGMGPGAVTAERLGRTGHLLPAGRAGPSATAVLGRQQFLRARPRAPGRARPSARAAPGAIGSPSWRTRGRLDLARPPAPLRVRCGRPWPAPDPAPCPAPSAP